MTNFPDLECIGKQVLEAAGHSSPPTDLNAVCSLWPDLTVSEENLDKEGYLIPLGVHGAELLIRRDDPPFRKKFTIAHELGHWVLANLDNVQVRFGKANQRVLAFRTEHKRQTTEEAWCNRFAASLLMPKEDIHRYLHSLKEVNLLDSIIRGPSIFRVSQEAFLFRVADITHVSLFEVASAGATLKVRRRFFSKHEQPDQVEHVIGELLNGFQATNDFPQSHVLIDTYHAQTKLIRASRYSRSWLVLVFPANNDNVTMQPF